MKQAVTITRPNNQFGSAIKETTIGFPAQRLTKFEAIEFLGQLTRALEEVCSEK